MRIHRGLADVSPERFRRPVVTIGVFDGVHRGHARVLEVLRAEARGGDAVAITFDTHPRAVLEGRAPPRLTSLDHRLLLLARAGVDATIVLHFDERLAEVGAEEFLTAIVIGRIGARSVVLGADSHFGRGREGNVAFLERVKGRLGLDLRAVPLVVDEKGETVSSTAIRRAVLEGRLEDAARMLGRPVSVLGRVVEGDRRGRTLGFPTANLDLVQEIAPPRGVYLALVPLAGEARRALVNRGVRPTVERGAALPQETFEVHILGFEGDLYGRSLEVFFVRKLRDERRFPSLDALVAAIERDRAEALEAPVPPPILEAARQAVTSP
jgi:riboflavin kinase/FMN adenylyltransferase